MISGNLHSNDPVLRVRHRLAWTTVAGIALICPPVFGIIASGLPLARYFQFPPHIQYIVHAGHAGAALALFMLLGVMVVAALVFVVWPRPSISPARAAMPAASRRFPTAGWLALLALALSWLFAWTRWEVLAALQSYSFVPLWLSYIALINALTWWRSGTCLWCRERGFFLALFPTSALFWWYFEYLNRFVQNWQYIGINVGDAVGYAAHATLAFSTVLPAVASTQELLATFPVLRRGWSHPVVIRRPRRLALVVLVVSLGILFAIGIWPNILYASVWVAPLGVLLALETLAAGNAGTGGYLAPLRSGRWAIVYLPALAALCCGICWEMWNEYSAAKWIYHIGYVEQWKVFEMPLLGYLGYLPFGVQCAVAIDLLRRVLNTADERSSGQAP